MSRTKAALPLLWLVFGACTGASDPDETKTDIPTTDDDPTDTLPTCSDCDGDGFAGGSAGQDCDDTDPDVHPGAPETCGDGIDSNCDGADPTCSTTDTTFTGGSGSSYTDYTGGSGGSYTDYTGGSGGYTTSTGGSGGGYTGTYTGGSGGGSGSATTVTDPTGGGARAGGPGRPPLLFKPR